jgi:gas vesicle protein
MSGQRTGISTAVLLAGACIGGGLALLAAPQTGSQFRNSFKALGIRALHELSKNWLNVFERGIGYAERGHRVLRDAEHVIESAIDRGKDYLESSQRTMQPARYSSNFVTTGAMLAGICIGGGLALLFAPRSGAELRDQLRGYGEKTKDRVVKSFDSAVEQGNKFATRG